MRPHRSPVTTAAALVGGLLLIVGAGPGLAASDVASGLVATSGVSPFASCTADNLDAQLD